MKKTYISPATMVATIETEQVVCGSLRYGANDADMSRPDLVNDRYDYDEEEEDLW